MTVPVRLNNNPGIWSIRFDIQYDREKLELTDATFEGAFAEGSMTSPLDNDVLTYTWENQSVNSNLSDNGVLVNLVFKVSGDVAVGDVLDLVFVNYDPEDFFKVEGENGENTINVPFTFGAGQITIVKEIEEPTNPTNPTDPAVKYGDINSDGKYTATDSMYIRLIVAELDQPSHSMNYTAADVNGDEKYTAADTMYVRRLVAELITEEELPVMQK